MPRLRASSSLTPYSAAYLRTSPVIFIEQKCAVFAPSCGRVWRVLLPTASACRPFASQNPSRRIPAARIVVELTRTLPASSPCRLSLCEIFLGPSHSPRIARGDGGDCVRAPLGGPASCHAERLATPVRCLKGKGGGGEEPDGEGLFGVTPKRDTPEAFAHGRRGREGVHPPKRARRSGTDGWTGGPPVPRGRATGPGPALRFLTRPATGSRPSMAPARPRRGREGCASARPRRRCPARASCRTPRRSPPSRC